MSSGDEHEPKFPSAGSKITWLSFNMRVEFHPPIRIQTLQGHEFAASIHSAMEAGVTNVDGPEWVLRGARAYDGMTVRVGKQSISLTVVNPQYAQNWYEDRFTSILESFAKRFSPRVVLSADAMANGLVPIIGSGSDEDADARAFLGGNLTFMHPKKLDAISRPLHILGIRLLFPPFVDENGEETDWGVDVKAESWNEDPSQLYLEADADWQEPEQWEDDTPAKLVGKLKIVTDFMNTRLLDFLHQHPLKGLRDETDGNEGETDDE